MRDRFSRLGDRAAHVCLWAGAFALLVIVIVNGVNVVARYIFRAPFPWAEEAMLYTMIAGVFTGAVAIAWQQRHIRIDAFVYLLPERARRIVEIVAATIAVAVLFLLGFIGVRVTALLFAAEQTSDALQLPMWIPNSVVAAAVLLMAVALLVRLLLGVAPPSQVDAAVDDATRGGPAP